ncbi:hypothetical protein ACOMHN_051431 [Nucella lapillus]
MGSRVRTTHCEERSVSRRNSSHPDIILVTAEDEGGAPQGKTVSLSARDHTDLVDDLALLFTTQEERCFSRASRDNPGQSRVSLTSSQLAEATFIYQHVDFQVLSRCVPGFVKSHLNKNGRYQPETFILRVNYLRRRRALGERAAKDNTVKDNAAKENAAKDSTAKTASDSATSQSRGLVSGKSSRT